ARHRRAAETGKRIEHRFGSRQTVQPQALLGELRRERGRVWTVPIASLNRRVRDEPGVPAAPDTAGGCAPPADVRGVLIGDAESEPIEPRVSVWCEMEHELVTVVQESITVDRLVVPYGEVPIEAGAAAGKGPLDGDRLDPV